MLTDADLRDIAADLGAVPGVVAVALGGSRARGTHLPDSDVDLGIYTDAGLDRVALSAAASAWADEAVSVGPAGSWGPWVDSGAWLTVAGTKVDVIVRDVSRVRAQCDRARHGEFAFHSQPGHPLGFLDVAYAGEVALCVPLVDDSGVLAALAAALDPYPDALRRALVANLWQVDFLLDAAGKAVDRRDATFIALCVADAVMILAHGWHAASGRWVVNEKGLVPAVDRLPGAPHDFGDRAARILGSVGVTGAELRETIADAQRLPRPHG